MNYEHTKNPNVYEVSIPTQGNYAELANSICGLKRKSQTCCLLLTRGRATLNYIPKRKPYGSKIATETPCHRSETEGRGLSVHYGNQEYK